MKGKINKYSILLLLMVMICLVLLPKCFQKEEMVFQVEGSSIAEITSSYYSGPEMVLAPGVYQVRVHGANLPEGGMMTVTLACPISSYKALRGNAVTMYAGQKELDFEVYVLDTLESARLECSLTNVDYSAISEISVYRTNIGARLLLCLFLFGGGIVCIMMRFRDKILAGKTLKSRQIAVWSLLAGVFIAFIPYLGDYIIMGADRGYHLLRIEGLKETLLYGNQFPIRVQAYWLYGHGYMTSAFYSDFFLYFPAILRIIGFPLGLVSKVYLFTMLAVHAAIAFHCLYKCTDNDYAALLGSLCTLLAPYHFHNIYNRGALGEYTAMAFLPLVIAGMFLLYTKEPSSPAYKSYKWYLIAGLSALLQCHLITCEMSAVMVIVFCLIHFRKTFRRETFVQLAQAAGIILLANCFFWLPMLHMMGSDTFAFHSLAEESIRSKGIAIAHLLQLTTNKGGAQTGMYNAEAMQPGAALLFALLLFALYGLKAGKSIWRKYCVHSFIWVVVLLCLSTKYFPWDALKSSSVLNFLTTAIQFPYRLLSPVIMIGGFFLAFFYLWLRQRFPGWICRGCTAFIVALCLISAIYQANDIAYASDATRLYSTGNITICYKEMPLYLAADFVSLISVLLLAGFKLFQMIYRRKAL